MELGAARAHGQAAHGTSPAVRGAAVEGCESPAERLPSTFCVGVGWTPGTWPSEAHSAAPTHKTNAAHTASAGLQLMLRLRGWRISAARSFAFASRVDVAVNPPSCRVCHFGQLFQAFHCERPPSSFKMLSSFFLARERRLEMVPSGKSSI